MKWNSHLFQDSLTKFMFFLLQFFDKIYSFLTIFIIFPWSLNEIRIFCDPWMKFVWFSESFEKICDIFFFKIFWRKLSFSPQFFYEIGDFFMKMIDENDFLQWLFVKTHDIFYVWIFKLIMFFFLCFFFCLFFPQLFFNF